MRVCLKYRNDERGAVAIEGAFLLPLMALVGFGAIDASMMLRQTHAMEQGLVSGAGYLARAENPQQSSVQTQAKNIAVSGKPGISSGARVSGWDAGDVSLTIQSVLNNDQYRGGNNILVAKLSTNHTYAGLGFIRLASGGAVKIRVQHEERLVRAQ